VTLMTRAHATYVSWTNGDSLVVHVHSGDNYAHLAGSFESEHIGFLFLEDRRDDVTYGQNVQQLNEV